MDATATARRRKRRKNILENAEERLKKLAGNFNGAVKHDENFDKQTETDKLILRARQNVNDGSSTKADQNCEKSITQGENVFDENDLVYQDKPTEMRDKAHGFISDDIETNEGDKATTHIPCIKERKPDQGDTKKEDKSTEMEDKTDGKETLYYTSQLLNDDSENEFDTVSEDVGSKISINVRSLLVMILGTLCFTKSFFLPAISSTLGSPWFLEIYISDESSFIIPFFILEIVLLFTPSIRKVSLGKEIYIWLLALKLSGLSPRIVDAATAVIMEIVEFLTDFAMFIFVLVILQNVKELNF